MMPEQPRYGSYEGQPPGSAQPIPPPPYGTGYQQPPPGGVIDDNFVEAVSQRIAQQMAQQSTGKVYGQKRSSTLPAALRGAIAIVSVSALIPLGIVLGLKDNLLALAIVGVVILAINGIVNGVLSFRD